MGQEKIDIVVSENGSRVVKRSIEDIGAAAKTTAGSVEFLKRTLKTIGIGISVAEIVKLMDEFQGLQNKLRGIGLEGGSLTAVWDKLVASSNRTRTSLEGNVQTYQRMSMAAKGLGASSQDMIDFTTRLNQTLILSGASSREAFYGLMDLQHGLAGGKLHGQQFKALMRELPGVIDVLTEHFHTNRAGLMALAHEGKITSKEILRAFIDAGPEIEKKFSKMPVTISQAFTQLHNSLITVVGGSGDASGATRALAESIQFLAQHLPEAIEYLEDLAGAVLAVGAAYGTWKLGTATTQFVAYHRAIANGTIVLQGSAEATRLAEVATLALMREQAAASAAELSQKLNETVASERNAAALVAEQTALRMSTEAELANAQARHASALAAKEEAVAHYRTGGMFRSVAPVREAKTELSAAAQGVSLQRGNLAAIQAAETEAIRQATEAKAAATAASGAYYSSLATEAKQLEAQQARTAVATVKAAGTATLFGQAAAAVMGPLRALWALVAANPVVAVVAVIVAAVAALVYFRDQISLGMGDATSLGDLMRATWEKIGPIVSAAAGWIKTHLMPVLDWLKSVWPDINLSLAGFLRFNARVVDGFVGLWRGSLAAIKSLFQSVWADIQGTVVGKFLTNFMDSWTQLGTTLVAWGQKLLGVFQEIFTFIVGLINRVIEGVNKLAKYTGANKIDLIPTAPPEGLSKKLEQYGKDASEAFTKGLNSSHGASDAINSLLADAQRLGKVRRTKGAPGELPGAGDTGPAAEEAAKIDHLQIKLDALRSTYDKVWGAQHKLAEGTKILKDSVDAHKISQEESNFIMGLMNLELEDTLHPIEAITRKLREQQDEQQQLTKYSKDDIEVRKLMKGLRPDLQTDANRNAIKEEVRALREATEAAQQYNAIQNQINMMGNGTAEGGFKKKFLALGQMQRPGSGTPITEQQANDVMYNDNTDLYKGSEEANQRALRDYQDTTNKIMALYNARYMNERTKDQALYNAKIELQQYELSNTRTFFDDLSSLSQLKNNELARIGKAAAITTVAIDGIVAVQKALASTAPPMNYALAAAAEVKTAVNIAKIAGYANGGDFEVQGTGGTDSQTVAFRATPGEKVSVRTPAQTRPTNSDGAGTPSSEAAPTSIKVVNVLDPAMLTSYLTSSEGESVLVNTIRRNSDTIGQALKVRG